MLNLILRPVPVEIAVPDMGLSAREWAQAVFAATNIPFTTQYGVPGALEVAAALQRAGEPTSDSARRFGVGDRLEVSGQHLTCIAVDDRGVDAWGVGVPTFTDPEPVPAPPGPAMHVSKIAPPPVSVAYVEDARDRLWTGRGAGEWRCLTDAVGRTWPGLWASVWENYGPLTPLVPVQRADGPVPDGLRGEAVGARR